MTQPIGQPTIQVAAPTPGTAGTPAPAESSPPVQPAARITAPQPVVDTVDVIPSTPPAEVLAEVRAAVARVAELHAQGRELHFSHDNDSSFMVVQVRDLDGEVLRTIPPSQALAVMSGEEL